jgi:hypothetical protein
MDALLYVIGVLLVLIVVELLILTIEVVKLSSALQNFLLNRNSESQNTQDTRSLASLFSQLTDFRDKKGKEKSDTPVSESPQSATSTGRNVEKSENDTKDFDTQETFGTQDSPSVGGDASNSVPTGESTGTGSSSEHLQSSSSSGGRAASETKTAVSSFSVLKCPSCGRENSSFRKTCYFCETPLQDGTS